MLREWVWHHFAEGVDHIVLVDNIVLDDDARLSAMESSLGCRVAGMSYRAVAAKRKTNYEKQRILCTSYQYKALCSL